MRQVYLDYSATTPVKEEVLKEMIPYFSENFGNPSSLYTKGAISKEAITKARSKVSSLIGADENEIFFTASGTEADDWAIIGIADALKSKGNHIITTGIEHHAVLHSCEYLAKNGYEVTFLPVDKEGRVRAEDLETSITDKTILVSIMYVNNEVGTIQNIKELCRITKSKNVTFHTDAVQALGNVKINVKELAELNLENHIAKVTKLRNYFIDQVFEKIDDVFLNGSREFRHPGNVNITFEFIEGEAMLLYLDLLGISVSTGSACSSASLTPSHVLTCLGVPAEKIHGSLRFTIGDPTTKEDIDYVVEKLVEVVIKLRAISSVSKTKGW